MSSEENLKRLMEIKSGNVRAFAVEAGIKYTTLRSILDRGIMNSNVENVFKIANHLGIKPERLTELETTGGIIDGIIDISIQLENSRQEKVLSFATEQLEEQNGIHTIKNQGKTTAGSDTTYSDGDTEENK